MEYSIVTQLRSLSHRNQDNPHHFIPVHLRFISVHLHSSSFHLGSSPFHLASSPFHLASSPFIFRFISLHPRSSPFYLGSWHSIGVDPNNEMFQSWCSSGDSICFRICSRNGSYNGLRTIFSIVHRHKRCQKSIVIL